MNIKEKFLELTKRTYPHGTEKDLFPLLNPELCDDEFGNLFIKIGESDVMFTAHLDTATSALSQVVHVEDGKIIKTDGKSILGADDKAGVTIMLYMIENKIPGLYYFFLGEEVGCVGSRKVANKYKEQKITGINKVISFDRRGTNSVITFQSGSRCCSEKFGEELAKQLNTIETSFKYKNDPTGLLTDSIQFVSLYPECTNISVGYQHEHTYSENQDIEHLEKLAEACLKVDWNNLPVERDPSKTEYSSYGYGYGYEEYDYGSWGRSMNNSYGYTNYNTYDKKPIDKTEKVWFIDDKFDYVSFVELNKRNDVIAVDLCPERLLLEKKNIEKVLTDLEIDFDEVKWDGLTLTVKYFDSADFTCDRKDLIEYLPSLDYSKYSSLTEEAVEEYTSKKNYNSLNTISNDDWQSKNYDWDYLDNDLFD